MRTRSQVDDVRRSTRPAAVAGAGIPMIAGGVCVAGQPGAAQVVAVVFSFMVAASATPAPERLREVRSRAGERPGDEEPADPADTDALLAALDADADADDADLRSQRVRVRLSVPLALIAKMALIVVLVGAVSLATGAWWVGLAGAPLGARLCIAEARRRHVLAYAPT